MEILVLHPGALGDIILSLPALSLLRRHYPHARLTLGGNLEFVDAVARGYADRTRSLSTIPLHRLYSADPLPEEDVRFWKSYDRIVSWTGAGDAEFISRLLQTGTMVQVSPWKPDPLGKRHVARIFAESLYPWIPPVQSIPRTRIQIEPFRRDEAQNWLAERGWRSGEQLMALHPGAGSILKRWPIEHFRSMALQCLKEGNRKMLIVEGPAEAGLGRELAQGLTYQRILLAESLPLALLAALLTFCSGYAGNDSGISHLAAGLGVPSVVLFGSTSSEQWSPLGDQVIVLYGPSLTRILADQVWKALTDLRNS